MEINSVATLLKHADQLMEISDTAVLDVELLLSHALDVDRAWLKTWPEHILLSAQVSIFEDLFARRLTGEPIAFIIGSQGFWSLDLKVTPQTLIPRPETELLVETSLALDLPADCRAIDLGTGTGAIALALAKERPNWQLTAVDSEPAAVKLAELNSHYCQIDNVMVYQSDWFSQVPLLGRLSNYHLIVSNPPYIEIDDPHLMQGDVRFEPASALVSGVDGLDDLREVINSSVKYLETFGWLLVEHGYRQGSAVRELFKAAGFITIETMTDFNQLERITMGCLPKAD
ncbi:MAG: release factor glutamine methyltransferase [Polaribacter sp.]|jgi:release factor glutamine methyltransferase|tara:strand:- start:13162 stop:14022 length:861 start_codon:yes stop_codon:yes gene_type:complete